jgi:F0F1-type ATP synthase assembly protein I
MHKSTGSYELVLSPLLLALIGYGLDRWLGTLPLLTIIFAVLGLVGACIKIYYGYVAEMDEHEKDAPWAKHS